MLGSAAIFGSKGMVRVPTITGLSTSVAATTAQAYGLTVSSTGTVVTYETGLNGIVASQSPSANSLLDYGSAISYTYYVYETPPCSGTRTIWYAYCDGGQVTGSFEYDHCNVTFEQALAAYFPYGYPGTGGGAAGNGGPVSIDCGSGGGDNGGGQSSDCTDDDSGECRGSDYYVFQYSPSGNFSCSGRLAYPNDPSCAPVTCNETYIMYDASCNSDYRQYFSNCASVCL